MTSASRRPAELCRSLLDALAASEDRRRRRVRNTTPDRIGLALRRELLERAVREDPEPAEFEAWLFARCQEAAPADGPLRAVARDVFDEWRLVGTIDPLHGGTSAP